MLGNWIRQTTTTTGTGDITVAAVTDYPSLNDIFGLNRPFYYGVLDDATGKPIYSGIGHLSSSTTLVRDKTLASEISNTYSNADTAITLPSGTKRIVCFGDATAFNLAPHGINTPSGGSKGMYTVASSLARGTTTLTADRLYIIPIFIAAGSRLTAIKFRITTAATAGKVAKLALHTMNVAGWGDKQLDVSGNLAADATGVVSWSLTTPLKLAGWHYIAFTCNGTPALSSFTASSEMLTPLGIDGSLDAMAVAYKAIGTTLTMNDPMDAASGFTFAAVASGVPIMIPVFE